MKEVVAVIVATWLTILAAADKPHLSRAKRGPIVVSEACKNAPLAPGCMP